MKSKNTVASNHRNQPTGTGSYGSHPFRSHCNSLTVMWETLLTVGDARQMSKPCLDNSPSMLYTVCHKVCSLFCELRETRPCVY